MLRRLRGQRCIHPSLTPSRWRLALLSERVPSPLSHPGRCLKAGFDAAQILLGLLPQLALFQHARGLELLTNQQRTKMLWAGSGAALASESQKRAVTDAHNTSLLGQSIYGMEMPPGCFQQWATHLTQLASLMDIPAWCELAALAFLKSLRALTDSLASQLTVSCSWTSGRRCRG